MHTSNRSVVIATIAGITAIGLVSVLRAQPQEQPTAPATPDAPSVLGGPKVIDKTVKLTLVQRDSDGKLVRLEDRPEIAALPLLKLEGDAKKAADKVLNEHGAIVAKVINDQQGLFLQIQSARQSNDARAAAPLIRELRQKAPQLWEPSLLDRLAKALPVEKAAALRSIVTEYVAALAHEGTPDGRGPKPAGSSGGGGAGGMMEGGGMMQGEGGMMQGGGGGGGGQQIATDSIDTPTLRRIEANLIVRELARSLKTLTEMRREQTDRLLSGLGLTPEQDAQVRKLIHDTGAKSKNGQPSREDHRALIEEIKKLLTVEQVKALNENLKNR